MPCVSNGPLSQVPVVNEAITYIAEVTVGVDNQTFHLLVDSGSSNTWVGANASYTYIPSSSSVWTDDIVIVDYGSGYFFGYEYFDTVALSNELIIKNQSIGVADFQQGFNSMDGILGIGPVDLTDGTILGSLAPVTTVPTVSDNLFSEGVISTEVVGVSFVPTTGASNEPEGELIFGDIGGSSRFTGQITYTPKETDYWGITQSISYGDTEIMASAIGVVDTGTTLNYMPTDTFNAYINSTGGTFDEATGLYEITQEQYDALDNLIFTIGGTDFPLTANAQIWPRDLNENIGGEEGRIYLAAVATGMCTLVQYRLTDDLMLLRPDPIEDLNFINGYVFLERFFSIFDNSNSRVGFATTSYTNATTN
ncbi:aspartic peptidase domain-containing protein [Lentinula raphanica]|uniref:Aspartic peptidase domain-containing protein n=1 Tax=Lentinula raphanica TaxID=153919 RepID=A0AA38NYT5_9AGAR|nr:aspartic peptidase domain-containing protein [Lentinula raphanica]